jgi:two-component system heavy metal sensor histidine kinase CusS
MNTSCKGLMCSHSISRRLASKLALLTALVIGGLALASWLTVKMLILEKNEADLTARTALIADIVQLEAQRGGLDAVLERVRADAAMRAQTCLELWSADGRPLYAEDVGERHVISSNSRSTDFTVAAPSLPGGLVRARYTVDYSGDAELGRNWALVLTVVTLAASALAALGARWHVRRQLRPLQDLAAQTRAITPDALDQRLALADPAEELLPWIEQFNALMQRVERAYAQLEGFNADVAHELRTPLAALIGETEVALSRERSAESLRETLASNLEELQRLSALVNDMLFLSHADRGAMARRGDPVSLAALSQQVAEFHEATLEDAGLRLQVEGDAELRVDVPLVKRALSNLIGNATRFAAPGSTVRVVISAAPGAVDDAAAATRQVQVLVHNEGQGIAPQQLPQLFDRFFRGEASRSCPDESHHGLGLAIVAAIARMHAGRTVAESQAGVTRVGFTLALC